MVKDVPIPEALMVAAHLNLPCGRRHPDIPILEAHLVTESLNLPARRRYLATEKERERRKMRGMIDYT